MTHRVDTTMDPMESPRHRTPVDGGPIESQRSQLPTRNDAMLPRRHLRDRQISPVAFVSHTDTKATGPRFSPPGGSVLAEGSGGIEARQRDLVRD